MKGKADKKIAVFLDREMFFNTQQLLSRRTLTYIFSKYLFVFTSCIRGIHLCQLTPQITRLAFGYQRSNQLLGLDAQRGVVQKIRCRVEKEGHVVKSRGEVHGIATTCRI